MTIAKQDWRGTGELAVSLAFSTGIVYILKFLIHEPRPNGHDNLSFPSSHTSFASTAAGFMLRRYGLAWGAPYIALAGFTGYSRIESKWHWPHDVLTGGAIGFIAGYTFTVRF